MNQVPWVWQAVPLVCAFLYSVSALCMKRALSVRGNVLRLTAAMCLGMGITSQFLRLLPGEPQPGAAWWMPAGAGAAFVIGVLLNSLALHVGDVSIATPLLGTKVLLVAVLASLLTTTPVAASTWAAAGLVVAGLFLLRHGGSEGSAPQHFWRTVALAMASACSFALCDVLFQEYAAIWSLGRFAPDAFSVVGIGGLALLLMAPRRPDSPPQAETSIWAATAINSVQGLGIAASLALWSGGATQVNVLYNSRAIWSVVLVWAVGHWFGNTERAAGRSAMVMRLVGAITLVSAIVLVLWQANQAS